MFLGCFVSWFFIGKFDFGIFTRQFFDGRQTEMISGSPIASISAQPWLNCAHELRGVRVLACLLQPAMLPGKGHAPAADKPRCDREGDVGGLEGFGGKADFGSLALAGSGDM